MQTRRSKNSSEDNRKKIIIEDRRDKHKRGQSRFSFSMVYFVIMSFGWLGVNYILINLMAELEEFYKEMDFELSATTNGVINAGHKVNDILEISGPVPGWLMIGVPAVVLVLVLAYVCARIRILYFILIAALLGVLFFEIWALGSPFSQLIDSI